MKSKAAQTKPRKLIRRTCRSGHGSDDSGPKWHAPCSESAPQKKTFHPQRRGLRSTKSLSGDPEEESPSSSIFVHGQYLPRPFLDSPLL